MLSLPSALTSLNIQSMPILTYSYYSTVIKNVFLALVNLEALSHFEPILINSKVILNFNIFPIGLW